MPRPPGLIVPLLDKAPARFSVPASVWPAARLTPLVTLSVPAPPNVSVPLPVMVSELTEYEPSRVTACATPQVVKSNAAVSALPG